MLHRHRKWAVAAHRGHSLLGVEPELGAEVGCSHRSCKEQVAHPAMVQIHIRVKILEFLMIFFYETSLD